MIRGMPKCEVGMDGIPAVGGRQGKSLRQTLVWGVTPPSWDSGPVSQNLLGRPV